MAISKITIVVGILAIIGIIAYEIYQRKGNSLKGQYEQRGVNYY